MTQEPPVVGTMKMGSQGYIRREDLLFDKDFFVRPDTPIMENGKICIIKTPEGIWVDLIACSKALFPKSDLSEVVEKIKIVKVIRERKLNLSCLI